ncbi:unnamed protein product, partial [Citrullus colocynthis]
MRRPSAVGLHNVQVADRRRPLPLPLFTGFLDWVLDPFLRSLGVEVGIGIGRKTEFGKASGEL